jgi:tRNA dimethylallyltransferase
VELGPVRDCFFLTGPTGAGKSEVGVPLAAALDAQIVSLDSMAVYRGLDIGTAKPPPELRSQVKHHLLDVLEPEEDFSLAEYAAAARAAVDEIRSCRKQVLFVGGTPLYLKALVRGVFVGPPPDPALRRAVAAEAQRHGPRWLHAQVAAFDPAVAARLHPNDRRRLIRAWEVYEKTGRPISQWQRQFDAPRPECGCTVWVLCWPREELYRRIEARVEHMFASGLVAEVRALAAQGRRLGRTASQALGYREVAGHLAGQRDLAATVAHVKLRTRRFAKRQMTWFRRLSECRFVLLDGKLTPSQVAAGIAEQCAAARTGR